MKISKAEIPDDAFFRIVEVRGARRKVPKVFLLVGDLKEELSLGVELEDIPDVAKVGLVIAQAIVREAEKAQGVKFDSYKDGPLSVWFRKGR